MMQSAKVFFLCVSYWKAFLNREKLMGVLPREDEDDDKRVGDNDTEPMTGVTDLGRTCMTLVVCQQFFSVQSPSDACSTNEPSEKMLSSTLMILTYSSRTNKLKEIDFQPVTCHYTIIRRKSDEQIRINTSVYKLVPSLCLDNLNSGRFLLAC